MLGIVSFQFRTTGYCKRKDGERSVLFQLGTGNWLPIFHVMLRKTSSFQDSLCWLNCGSRTTR
jgi:hypothetical protein